MTSAAFSMPDDQRQRVSIRRRSTATVTSTSAAADEALQHVLDRRLRKREGRLPPPRRQPVVGGGTAAVASSANQLGSPQWLLRAAVLGFVTFVFGVAVFVVLPGKGGPQGVAVEGRVLLNGRPLAQAALEFHGVGATGPITVLVDTNETGTFRRPVSAGLPAGTYSVVVKSGCVMPNPLAERGMPVRIPARYTSVQSTPLKATVAGQQSSFEFALR